MAFKKIILMVFLLFALNFSFQPNSVLFARERHSITYTIDVNRDKYTEDLITEMSKKRFNALVSLTMNLLVLEETYYYNTS
jgi:hypothetical protein